MSSLQQLQAALTEVLNPTTDKARKRELGKKKELHVLAPCTTLQA